MACSCDSCSSARIIKTRTALFWRWLAQSRGETADRVIVAPVRAATVSAPNGLTDQRMPTDIPKTSSDAPADEADPQAVDRRRAEFLHAIRPRPRS